jgi:hypothetical protein
MNLDLALALVARRNEAMAPKLSQLKLSPIRRMLVLTIDSYYVVNYEDVLNEITVGSKDSAEIMLDCYDVNTEVFVKNNNDLHRITL